jgi:uncharacterized Zn finger protein (UPF0148 family)
MEDHCLGTLEKPIKQPNTYEQHLQTLAAPEKPSAPTPAPCPTCRCPLFWRPFTSGPIYCAVCQPPTNAKQWAMVVLDADGHHKFVKHVRGNLAGQPQPSEPATSATDEPQETFDEWWEEICRTSEPLLELMSLRAKKR